MRCPSNAYACLGSFTCHENPLADQLMSCTQPIADGWGFSQMSGGSNMGQHPGAIKQQTIGLLHAISYLKGERPRLLTWLLGSRGTCSDPG